MYYHMLAGENVALIIACRTATTLVALSVLSGCALDTRVTKSDHCTNFIRRGQTSSLAVRSDAVSDVVFLKEWSPPARFLWATFVLPQDLQQLGALAVYLVRVEDAFPGKGECSPTSNHRQACRLTGNALEASGFAVIVVAGEESVQPRIVQAGDSYLERISSCSDSSFK